MQGRGVLAVLEGSAGAGKSALLAVAAETGISGRACACSARAVGNWSRASPFGVIRQLYEPMLAARLAG